MKKFSGLCAAMAVLLVALTGSATATDVVVGSVDSWTEGNASLWNADSGMTVADSTDAAVNAKSIKISYTANGQEAIRGFNSLDLSMIGAKVVFYAKNSGLPGPGDVVLWLEGGESSNYRKDAKYFNQLPGYGDYTSWRKFEVPLSLFSVLTPASLSDIYQVRFGNNGGNPAGDLYIDGLHFERPATIEEAISTLEEAIADLGDDVSVLDATLADEVAARQGLQDQINTLINTFNKHVHDKGSGSRMTSGPIVP